jgi:hypothetical protein
VPASPPREDPEPEPEIASPPLHPSPVPPVLAKPNLATGSSSGLGNSSRLLPEKSRGPDPHSRCAKVPEFVDGHSLHFPQLDDVSPVDSLAATENRNITPGFKKDTVSRRHPALHSNRSILPALCRQIQFEFVVRNVEDIGRFANSLRLTVFPLL